MQKSDDRGVPEGRAVANRARNPYDILRLGYSRVLYLLTLIISNRHLERISLHSRESYPLEACGILIGTATDDQRTAREVWSARNELSSKSSYEIDPETLLRAFIYAEQNKLEVVGFYHSHPFWSAEASAIDRARANYPGLSYLIYSVPNREMKSFHFDGKQLVNEPVRTTAAESHGTREASMNVSQRCE